jgi:Xaa-Pro aminopeptidase
MRDPERANFPQTQVDPARMHLARLARLRAELRRIGCAGGLFYDPTNIRYATGTSNMQVYTLHTPAATSSSRPRGRSSCSSSSAASTFPPVSRR